MFNEELNKPYLYDTVSKSIFGALCHFAPILRYGAPSGQGGATVSSEYHQPHREMVCDVTPYSN